MVKELTCCAWTVEVPVDVLKLCDIHPCVSEMHEIMPLPTSTRQFARTAAASLFANLPPCDIFTIDLNLD